MALLLKRELVIMKAENSVFIHIHETYLTMNINSKCLKPGSKQKWKLLQRYISKRMHTQKYISTGYLLKLHLYVDIS